MYEIDSFKADVTRAILKLANAAAEVESPAFKQRCAVEYPAIDAYPAKTGYLLGTIASSLVDLSETCGALAKANRAVASVAWLERCAAICEALGIDEDSIGPLELATSDRLYRPELGSLCRSIEETVDSVRTDSIEREHDNAVTMIEVAGFEQRTDADIWNRVNQSVAIQYKRSRGESFYEFALEVDGTETLKGRSGGFAELLAAVGISQETKANA